MSIELSSAEHGEEISSPLPLDPDNALRFALVPNTSIGVTASGKHNLTTTEEIYMQAGDLDVFIYRAVLTPVSDDTDHNKLSVVVKLAGSEESFEGLINEGRLYATELAPLVQESLVPVCYGAFRVTNDPDYDQPYGCLILQDCGEPLVPGRFGTSGPGYVTERNLRFKLLNAILKMHRCGVMHGHLDFRHLVLREDSLSPYIVGFTGATTDHTCECSLDITKLWRASDGDQTEETVNCPEIYAACELLGAFTPKHFECFGMYHPVQLIETADLEKVAKRAPTYMYKTDALKLAYEAMHRFASKWLPELAEDLERDIKPGLEARAKRYKTSYLV